MTHVRRTPRIYIRLGCLILAVLLVCPIPYWVYHSRILVQASPFVTICTMLAGGTLGLGSIFGIGFSIVVIFRKRWFCRYICPVGLILDGASGMGFKKHSWWTECPSIGRYVALITAAGAVTGYPLLLWMDPLIFFNSAFSVFTSESAVLSVLSITGFIILILISITSGGLWCVRICPLGATQDLMSNIGSILKKIKTTQKPESDNGLKIQESFPVTRRTLLAIAAGMGLSLWAKNSGMARAEKVLRPPGSIDEDEFTGQCVRCGNCTRVCPSEIIQADTGKSGVLGFMTPVVSYKKGYCIETCNECTKICPSGALKKLTLDKKNKYIIGRALLDPSLCYMVRGVNDCDICVRSCPFDAVYTYWDDEAYVAFPFVDPAKCNGCGACERFCPTGDIRAITVLKV